MTETTAPKIWPDNALHIESMDLDAQGVAHRADGKVVFVDGALPFEVVRANVHRKKNNWEQASLLEVLQQESAHGASLPEFFQTHPLPESRMENIEALEGMQDEIKSKQQLDSLFNLLKSRVE